MADDERRDVFTHPGFERFWTASAVSDFGSYITTITLQVLVVLTLDGSAAEVGFLNASLWLPYLLFGLVVGALARAGPEEEQMRTEISAKFRLDGFATSLPWLASSPSTRGQTRSATSRSPSPV